MPPRSGLHRQAQARACQPTHWTTRRAPTSWAVGESSTSTPEPAPTFGDYALHFTGSTRPRAQSWSPLKGICRIHSIWQESAADRRLRAA
eukprot:914039-Pyramimonas_sp.AAC.1